MNHYISAVAHAIGFWLHYWAIHCWQCEKERDYQASEKCPHCGADQTAF